MGLSACILIALFVADEFNYDRYNEKADRIFRIVYDAHLNGNAFVGNFAPFPMGAALAAEYPQIEKTVRIRYQGDIQVRKGNEKVIESRSVFADSTIFDVFTLPMIAGDPRKSLSEPYSVVISEHIAKKYFNNTAILGQTLVIQNNSDTTTYKITGVIKDIPAASHFHFDIIRSITEKHMKLPRNWVNPNCATYILAKPGVTSKEIDQILNSAVAKHVAASTSTADK